MSKENPLHANERLREERLQRGWSQQKLADKLGIAVVTVNRWERGKQQPTGYYRLKLTTLFEKSAAELGLLEEPTETTSPQESQRSENEAFPIAQADQVQATLPPSPLVEPSSLEREIVQRPISSSPYAQPDRLLQNRRKYTIRLFLILALIITVVSITFSIVRLNTPTGSKPPTQIVPTHPVPIQNSGKLVLDDPLTTPNGGGQWGTGDVCKFTGGALHMTSPGTNYCSAGIQSFDNMTFQIDMSLQKGIWAGITFRADDNSSLYYFSISVDGHYKLDRLKHNSSLVTLLYGLSPALLKGYNQFNTLTVEANKTKISLWVNNLWIGQTHDTFFAQGYVGIGASSYEDTTETLVEATFRNAKVWQI